MTFSKTSDQTIIANEITQALSFKSRLIGLLGTSELTDNQGMWFDHCQSVHTFGMQIPIDVVFVSKSFQVIRIYHELKPWRMTSFVKGAFGALELKSGRAKSVGINVGDQLHVER